jgi:hypothetical protein
MKSNDISKIVQLVFSSERQMPAHFTSGNEKSQTFLVKYDGLPADAEYEMASQAWHNQPERVPESHKWNCIKIGEDITLGSYLFMRMGCDGKRDLLIRELIDFNTHKAPKKIKGSLVEILQSDKVQSFFNFCENFGYELATADRATN